MGLVLTLVSNAPIILLMNSIKLPYGHSWWKGRLQLKRRGKCIMTIYPDTMITRTTTALIMNDFVTIKIAPWTWNGLVITRQRGKIPHWPVYDISAQHQAIHYSLWRLIRPSGATQLSLVVAWRYDRGFLLFGMILQISHFHVLIALTGACVVPGPGWRNVFLYDLLKACINGNERRIYPRTKVFVESDAGAVSLAVSSVSNNWDQRRSAGSPWLSASLLKFWCKIFRIGRYLTIWIFDS